MSSTVSCSRRGADRLGVHAELGEDGGDRERVRDVRVAALALLVTVPARGDVVGSLHRPDIGLRMRGADGLDKRFEYRVHYRTPAGLRASRDDGARRRRAGQAALPTRFLDDAPGAARVLGRFELCGFWAASGPSGPVAWLRVQGSRGPAARASGRLAVRCWRLACGRGTVGLVAVAWSVSPRASSRNSAVSPIRAASAPAVAVVITSPATSAPRICRGTSLLVLVNPRVYTAHSAVAP